MTATVELQIEETVASASQRPEPTPVDPRVRERQLLIAAWVLVGLGIALFAWQLAVIGVDLRDGVWAFSLPARQNADIAAAFAKGDAVLHAAELLQHKDDPSHTGPPGKSQIYRAWREAYDPPAAEPLNRSLDLDNPPLRLLLMTLWARQVESNYPGLHAWPATPVNIVDPVTHRHLFATQEIARPLLNFNTACEAVAAVAMFLLVWVWMWRESSSQWPAAPWQQRWGDPLLLAPVAVLAVAMLLRPIIAWHQNVAVTAAPLGPIDQRIVSPGFWLFLVLRFLSVVCLARFLPRPFRAPVCATLAAALLWVNPALLLESHAWPQWDAWLLPIFLVAAVLASVDWWFSAGLVLGAGMMLKGQLVYVIPMLALWPLLAGWPVRFLRMAAGLGIGAAVIVWPWIIANHTATVYCTSVVLAAVVVCIASAQRNFVFFHGRRLIHYLDEKIPTARFRITHDEASASQFQPRTIVFWRWQVHAHRLGPYLWISLGVMLGSAVALSVWAMSFNILTSGLLLGIVILPWITPRRFLATWLVFVLAAAVWLSAWTLDGKFGWWDTGLSAGPAKLRALQLPGDSMSNVSSLLQERFAWKPHDPVTELSLPFVAHPIALDLQDFLWLIYVIALVLCAIGLAMHSRRNDPRVLIALLAPWVIFPGVLTEMSARQTVVPAALSACLVGVSVGMSLWQLLLTLLSCAMLGNQMMQAAPALSPVALSVTRPMHPELGWMTALVAASFIYLALMPGRRRQDNLDIERLIPSPGNLGEG